MIETLTDFEKDLCFSKENPTKKAKIGSKKLCPKLGSSFENFENSVDAKNSKFFSKEENFTEEVTQILLRSGK